jgi:hypothetical protein
MTDREFRDNALIAVSASLAVCRDDVIIAGARTSMLVHPSSGASHGAERVAALLGQRKAREGK